MTGFDDLRDWAIAEPKVWTSTLRILFFSLPDLDGTRYRPLKQSAIAKGLNLSQARVSQGLTILVHDGYLVQGPKDGNSNTYRLNLTHTAIQHLAAQP